MHRLIQTTAAFIFLACASVAVAGQTAKPGVELKAISIQGVDWSKRTAATTVSIEIDNPGPAFKIKDLKYKLKVNDQQAAEGKYEKEVEVAAESKATIGLPCTVDLAALPGLTWSTIGGGFDVTYELKIDFTVPLFGSAGPKLQNTFKGDLSLSASLSAWSSKIKERLPKVP